jgi:hypothetical protein
MYDRFRLSIVGASRHTHACTVGTNSNANDYNTACQQVEYDQGQTASTLWMPISKFLSSNEVLVSLVYEPVYLHFYSNSLLYRIQTPKWDRIMIIASQ